MRSLFIARRYASTTSIGHMINAAKHLTSLKQVELGQKLSRAEADAEAKEWIQSIKQTRDELTDGGKSAFTPSKAFIPDHLDENDKFNFVQYTREAAKAEGLYKFQPNEEQLAEHERLKDKPIPERNDKIMNYLTNTIMRHGRKGLAQKMMSQALYLVQLKTRENPVEQLKTVLDKMAPLVKLRKYSDGGARSEMVPAPMTETQRLRQAWMWILDASERRPSKDFSVRLSEEIISAIRGKSPGFEKKIQQHKQAIVNRSYVSLVTRRKPSRGSRK